MGAGQRAMASRLATRYTERINTSMHSCFVRFGSPRRRQALQGGGGVTVVSRGDVGGVRAKIVVSRGELERIAAGVTRRMCGGAAGRSRHVAAAPELQLARAPPRSSEPEEGAGAAALRGEWRPALDGVPEDA